jgi:hypothetical protein
MKLFQRLLVAPAALGLMAPVAANADTAFSSTTSLSGSAFFTVGSVSDGGPQDNQEELYMQYAYGLDINSSFTGQDLLYVGIETGNAVEGTVGTTAAPLAGPDGNSYINVNNNSPLSFMDSAVVGDNSLNIASLFYSFPVGDLTVTAGPLVDQDDVVAATTSAYSDTFRLGSMPFSLAGNETGPGIGVSYNADNGLVASASFVSPNGANSTIGINSDDADDVTTLTLGFNGDGFGGGIVYANNDNGDNNAQTLSGNTLGVGVYYTPESIPATISVAYDSADVDGFNSATDLFVGVDYQVGPGTLSAAYNSTDVDGTDPVAGLAWADQTGFEVSYSYALNDSMTITPGWFSVEDNFGEDDTGFVVETVFSF